MTLYEIYVKIIVTHEIHLLYVKGADMKQHETSFNPLMPQQDSDMSLAMLQASNMECDMLEELESLDDMGLEKIADTLIKKKSNTLMRHSKQTDIEVATKLNQNLVSMVESVTDPALIQRVKESVKNTKDYKNLTSSMGNIVDTRNKINMGLMNDYRPSTGKRVVIRTHLQGADGSQVTTEVGVDNG